jgi:hypothetical protein
LANNEAIAPVIALQEFAEEFKVRAAVPLMNCRWINVLQYVCFRRICTQLILQGAFLVQLGARYLSISTQVQFKAIHRSTWHKTLCCEAVTSWVKAY